MNKFKGITDKQIDILENAKIINNKSLELPKMTDRDYDSIKVILESLGYHWVERYKCFKLYTDGNINDYILEVNKIKEKRGIYITEDEMFKRETEFYPTPENIVNKLVNELEVNDGGKYNILEPSAGRGNILEKIIPYASKYTALEKNRLNYNILINKGYKATNLSFEIFVDRLKKRNKDIGLYDRVIMNPPFSCALQHIQLGFSLLKPGGILVSIIPENLYYRGDRNSTKLREYIERYNGKVIELDSGSFSESGTNVETMIIKLRYPK